MKRIALAKIKDDLSGYLRRAEHEEILVTRHGRPAGVLIGFESEDDWFEYRIQNSPEFLERVERARRALSRGEGVLLEAAFPAARTRKRSAPAVSKGRRRRPAS